LASVKIVLRYYGREFSKRSTSPRTYHLTVENISIGTSVVSITSKLGTTVVLWSRGGAGPSSFLGSGQAQAKQLGIGHF
jgi:hypothetical protein